MSGLVLSRLNVLRLRQQQHYSEKVKGGREERGEGREMEGRVKKREEMRREEGRGREVNGCSTSLGPAGTEPRSEPSRPCEMTR